jgi:hypothetical protein
MTGIMNALRAGEYLKVAFAALEHDAIRQNRIVLSSH